MTVLRLVDATATDAAREPDEPDERSLYIEAEAELRRLRDEAPLGGWLRTALSYSLAFLHDSGAVNE